MTGQITITARIPQELESDMVTLAKALQRSKSWIVEAAIREFVDRERAFLAAVDAGMRAEEAGELVEHAEVVTTLEQIVSTARMRKAS